MRHNHEYNTRFFKTIVSSGALEIRQLQLNNKCASRTCYCNFVTNVVYVYYCFSYDIQFDYK
jgi:hypothetical protein